MFPDTLDGWLPGIPQSRDVDDVEREVSHLSARGRIGLLWPSVPSFTEALDLLVIAVGIAAQKHAVSHKVSWPPDRWSRAVRSLLIKNQLPIPQEFARGVTIHRLVRWIDSDARFLVMGVTDRSADLRIVENIGEWFSQAANAPCLILKPSNSERQSDAPPPGNRLVGSLLFRSQAEQQLFEALNGYDDLRNLFEPNVRVLTRFETAPCVDLLWREGRVIVEIDSYFTHGKPTEFSNDRQRDYETLVSGYITLRLVYEEITRDPTLAVAKIRRVIALRREGKI
jgi:hypothetical protein